MVRVLLAGALLVAACGGTSVETTVATSPATTSPATSSPVTTLPVTTSPVVPSPLEGFETTTITIDDVAYLVAVADDPGLRSQGLMEVEDLGDLAGMLFIFDDDTTGTFWMKNTLIPLDIAFFDAEGDFVDDTTMEPCPEVPCPSYSASGPYRYAVEVPAGDFDWLSGTERLVLQS